jgi:hypothetical protein
MIMAKSRYFQLRLNEDEDKFLAELAEDYRMDRSKLILFALDFLSEKRPAFVIEPRGKELALAGSMEL